MAVFLKSLFTGQEPWDTFCIISGQLLVAGIPARPRDPERGGRSVRARAARADSPAFRRRLARQPAEPSEGKLAAEPNAGEAAGGGRATGSAL